MLGRVRVTRTVSMIACLLAMPFGCASSDHKAAPSRASEVSPPPTTTPTDVAVAADAPGPSQAVAEGPQAIELTASDGTTIYGTLYAVTSDPPRPIILLFHQAGSSAAEYAPIAPRLGALGYDALAIDQRSGGGRFGKNATVGAVGKSTGYLAAYPDLEAALAWATKRNYPQIIVWGSSYSASLVFKLAAEHPRAITAVLAFSPGEYFGDHTVSGWAAKVRAPTFIAAAAREAARSKPVFAALPGDRNTWFVPHRGVHGSSMLRADQNPDGEKQAWEAVEAFLASVD